MAALQRIARLAITRLAEAFAIDLLPTAAPAPTPVTNQGRRGIIGRRERLRQ